MQVAQDPTNTVTLVVKALRKRTDTGLNPFYAGPRAGSNKAKDRSDTLGCPISNQPGFYPVVVNFPQGLGQTITLEDADGTYEKCVDGAVATVAVPESELAALNGTPFAAVELTISATSTALNTRSDYNSKIYGNVWVEMTGELHVKRAKGFVPRDTADEAIAANIARQEERQAQLATQARDAVAAPTIKADQVLNV